MEKMKVGVQVYSVREEAEKDFAGTMRKIKEMGYDGVELAGTYGIPTAEIAAILKENGLAAISAHVPVFAMMEDAQQVIDDYKTIGCRYLAVPYLPAEMRYGTPAYQEVLEVIRKMGRLCRENGMTLLYHNHDFEFEKNEKGEYPLDLLYAEIPAELLQTELDTCWVKVSGIDPAGYIRKYENRCPIVHLKDYVGEKSENMYALIGIDEGEEKKAAAFAFRAVGDGCQDWAPILEASAASGAEWVVVEQDHVHPPMEDIARSRSYLKELGW
jgi:sugar phosphate isomerase/epimerase